MANLSIPGHQLAGDFFIWNGVLVEKGYSSEKKSYARGSRKVLFR